MADQAGMRAVNQAVAALADDPEPPEVFVRGSYRRLRVGTYRVSYRPPGRLDAASSTAPRRQREAVRHGACQAAPERAGIDRGNLHP